MALLNVSFDAVSEAHLRDLVSTGVPEGVFLEYKRTTYGNGDADVKEYLKDVSSFANTHGGDLERIPVTFEHSLRAGRSSCIPVG